jgi:hypothetical protein
MLNGRRHAEHLTDALRPDLAVGHTRVETADRTSGPLGDIFPYYGPDPEISNVGGAVALVTAPAATGLIITLGSFVFYNNMSVRRTGWNERATVGRGILVNRPEVRRVDNGGKQSV